MYILHDHLIYGINCVPPKLQSHLPGLFVSHHVSYLKVNCNNLYFIIPPAIDKGASHDTHTHTHTHAHTVGGSATVVKKLSLTVDFRFLVILIPLPFDV